MASGPGVSPQFHPRFFWIKLFLHCGPFPKLNNFPPTLRHRDLFKEAVILSWKVLPFLLHHWHMTQAAFTLFISSQLHTLFPLPTFVLHIPLFILNVFNIYSQSSIILSHSILSMLKTLILNYRWAKLSKINLILLIKYLVLCILLNTINGKQNWLNRGKTMATLQMEWNVKHNIHKILTHNIL